MKELAATGNRYTGTWEKELNGDTNGRVQQMVTMTLLNREMSAERSGMRLPGVV